MSQEEQRRTDHRGTGRLRRRAATVLVPACVLMGGGQALLAWTGTIAAGASSASGPLAVAITSYAGDSVTSSPSESALAGSNVTYQVAVTNAGAATQTDVSVPITLPTNFTLAPATVSVSAGTVATGGATLRWSVPSLAAGATISATYTEAVDAPSAFESDATTAAATSAQSPTATAASSSVGVVPAADLSVAVSDGVDAIAPGTSDTDTITVTNSGPSAATNATVSDAFTPATEPLSGVSSLSDADFSDLDGGQSEWTGVNLAAGASATFGVTGTVPASLAAGSTLLNLVTVSTAPGEVHTNPVDDAADSDVVTGTPATGALGLTISSFDGNAVTATPSESALAGADVTYQVTVTNTTASAQSGVSIPVTLPSGFTLDSSVTPSVGSASVAGGAIAWSIPSLAAGASATLDYAEVTDAPAAVEADVTSASATSNQSATTVGGSDTVDVIPAANLVVSVSDGVDSIAPGESDTYTLTLTNDGPSAASNVTVSDAFNGGYSAFSAVSSISGTSFANLGTDAFAWTSVSLASGASATFSLMGSVSSTLPAGSAFVNLASATLPPGQVVTGASSTAVDSNAVIAAPQVITFTAPTTGDAGQSVVLSATGGGSGSPVAFSIDPLSAPGVCAVTGTEGSTLEFEGAGLCVVDANQAGNASFAAAPTVSASITVEQSPVFTADTPPPTDVAGDSYSYLFAASGAPSPTYALATGAPPWLTLDPTSGALSGTPTSGTTSFSYSVVATNDVGSTTVGPFTVTVTQAGTAGHADLSTALACPTTVALEAEGSCTLTVRNGGPATARAVTAQLALPFRLHRIAATGGAAWLGNAGAWLVGSLAPGSSASFSVTFRAVVSGRATVFAAALTATPDPSITNTVAVAAVDVTGQAWWGAGHPGGPVHHPGGHPGWGW